MAAVLLYCTTITLFHRRPSLPLRQRSSGSGSGSVLAGHAVQCCVARRVLASRAAQQRAGCAAGHASQGVLNSSMLLTPSLQPGDLAGVHIVDAAGDGGAGRHQGRGAQQRHVVAHALLQVAAEEGWGGGGVGSGRGGAGGGVGDWGLGWGRGRAGCEDIPLLNPAPSHPLARRGRCMLHTNQQARRGR